MAAEQRNGQVRYEPDQPFPIYVSAIAGFQGMLFVLTAMVTPITTGQSDSYLTWAAFVTFLICGVITALQMETP